MLDLVEFLEKVGQDASLSQTAPEVLLSSSLAAQLTTGECEALAASGSTGLSAVLNTQAAYCMQFPAEEEGEEEREPEPDVDEPLRDAD
jgi:hypothetical protein